MRRQLLLIGVIGAMVAAPLARAVGGPPHEGIPYKPPPGVTFTPITSGSLALGFGLRRSRMLIGRNSAQTRWWPKSLRSYLRRVDFSKHNVLLVVDQNADWRISIESIEQGGTV